ncbi:MAG: hypothetical protein A2X46_12210 [Lentisphaerae bacterium GWF2_57_35]|nr:MAG: hypothetical protein A2X46_12210 [Lentisphaerae bacterium GWF2_57_35]
MSLIELLLAMIIVVLVVTVAMSLYHTVASTLQGQTERLEGTIPATDALRQITRDLTCAFAAPGDSMCDFFLKAADAPDSPALELSFCTAIPSPTENEIPWGEIRQVKYLLIANTTTDSLTLHRSMRPLTGPAALEPVQTNVLALGIRQIKMEAFDGEKWQSEWPGEDSPVLPQAIRIEMQAGSPRNPKPLITEVFIPAGNAIPSSLTRSTSGSAAPAP